MVKRGQGNAPGAVRAHLDLSVALFDQPSRLLLFEVRTPFTCSLVRIQRRSRSAMQTPCMCRFDATRCREEAVRRSWGAAWRTPQMSRIRRITKAGRL